MRQPLLAFADGGAVCVAVGVTVVGGWRYFCRWRLVAIAVVVVVCHGNGVLQELIRQVDYRVCGGISVEIWHCRWPRRPAGSCVMNDAAPDGAEGQPGVVTVGVTVGRAVGRAVVGTVGS